MNTFAPDATLAPAAAIARRRARAMAAFRDAGETFHAMISRASVFSEKAHRRSGSLHRDSIPRITSLPPAVTTGQHGPTGRSQTSCIAGGSS